MRPTRFLLVTCATLAGCGAPTHERPTAVGMPHFTSEFLAGGWVLAGASCDSDSGVIYRRDGRWIALGGSGTWQVKKGRLVETVVERFDLKRVCLPAQLELVARLERERADAGAAADVKHLPGHEAVLPVGEEEHRAGHVARLS